jgi:hypothetical protein
MIIALVSLAALALWGSLATVVVVSRDGYRRIPAAEIAR